MAGTIKTTITLPEDLHWRFKEQAPRRRLTEKDAIAEAVELWISAGSDAVDLIRLLKEDSTHPMRHMAVTAIERYRESRQRKPEIHDEQRGKENPRPRSGNQR